MERDELKQEIKAGQEESPLAVHSRPAAAEATLSTPLGVGLLKISKLG